MSRLVRLSAAEFRNRAGEAASVYGAAMRRSPEIVVQRREIVTSHTSHPGFVATAALADDSEEMLGFGYGYQGAPGQWWHDIVARALGSEAAGRWLTDGFELAELHVLPERHGSGLGRALLSDVMGRAAASHVVLSTPDSDSPARRLYRSAGFTDLLSGFYFPGSSEAYAIMGVDL